MPAYHPPLQPVAKPGQVLRLEPDGDLRRVAAVEPMAQVGPIDFGAATSGATATGPSGNSEIEVTELEHNQNQVGQYRAVVISNVEVELRQTGRQEQRMTNANTVSQWTPETPAQLREFFVKTDGVPYLVVNNPNNYDLDRTLILFHGFKYNLERGKVVEDGLKSQPISIPVDKLEQAIQTERDQQRPLQAGGRGVQGGGR